MPLQPPAQMPPPGITKLSALLREIGDVQQVQDVRPAVMAPAYPAVPPLTWVDVTGISPAPQVGDVTADGGKTFTRPTAR